MITDIRAQVLVDALPYIQKYHDKVVVVKYGGNAMINDELKDAVMSDIVLLSLIGIKVVLVHGGGPEISQMLKKVGKESKFINGLRYTDEETMDIVKMVLGGKVNKELVKLLSMQGGKAIGLTGVDGDMIVCHQRDPQLGLVGEIDEVNIKIIHDALDKGYIPVIATVGCDKEGNYYNINADTAADRIAAALEAVDLLLMTDIRGLLRDKNDDSTLIPMVYVSDVPALINQGIISGGMIPKVDCCVEAVRRGVNKAVILDGRVPHSLLIELFSKDGSGTMFTNR